MVSAWAVENLLLSKRVNAFREMSAEDQKKEAQKIYNDFVAMGESSTHTHPPSTPKSLRVDRRSHPSFSYDESFLGSDLEVNLDMAAKEALREKLEAGQISTTMFDTAERQCLTLLRFSVFPLWKSSSDFKNLLKKNKVADISELRLVRSSTNNLPRAHLEEHFTASIELEHV